MAEPLFILIVDDSPAFTSRMESILEEVRTPYNISVLSTCGEAKSFILNSDPIPDFILLDMNLPDGTGIDVLNYIKEEGKKSNVIVITNHSNNYYRKLCIELGAEHFLDKSTEFTDVPGIINQYLLK
ncbi:MAG TPA: response regulator [Chitinophagaceae bacterium]|nr:response regulator [Chitinophagaceae bacterium]MCB9055901.1 response regulator [Chitinophagales bacterium]HPG10340.1 response regulator [Chitinophagaceae bacterium]